MRKLTAIALIWIMSIHCAEAQVYSDDILKQKHDYYFPNVDYTIHTQLVANAPPNMSAKLKNVVLDMPLRDRHPLSVNFYATGNTIVVPVANMKFFSDLTTIWAWFAYRHCNIAPLIAYTEAISFDSPVYRNKNPYEVFGLKEGGLMNYPQVQKDADKFFTLAMNFVLAHELGHIFYEDSKTGGSTQQIELKEERADDFALELLAAVHIAPAGAAVLFALVRFGDIPPTDHPLSHQRLLKIASRLTTKPDQFAVKGFSEQQVLDVAQQIVKISEALKIIEAQKTLEVSHREFTQFQDACPMP